MQKFLVYDTETTGLPKAWNAPLTDFSNWPRIVEISWLVHDEDGNELKKVCYIVKPDGFIIPKKVSDIHKITTEKAASEGHLLPKIIEEFISDFNECEILIAHNISFDNAVLGCELLRLGKDNILGTKKKVCTMQSSTNYCKIPSPRGYRYKWPNLQELYKTLFNEMLEDAHSALVDASACARSFFELKKRGIINI